MAARTQMGQGARRTAHTVSSKKNTGRNNRSAYVSGSAVRKLDVVTAIEEKPVRKLSNATRKNREKATHMSLGYVTFLALAMCLAGAVLIGYIRLQAENTATIKHIAQMESQLNDLKLSNDEEYSRIVGAIDMNEVKRVAIEELGMQYAEAGQIVKVEGAGDDYVRQYKEMPK